MTQPTLPSLQLGTARVESVTDSKGTLTITIAAARDRLTVTVSPKGLIRLKPGK